MSLRRMALNKRKRALRREPRRQRGSMGDFFAAFARNMLGEPHPPKPPPVRRGRRPRNYQPPPPRQRAPLFKRREGMSRSPVLAYLMRARS